MRVNVGLLVAAVSNRIMFEDPAAIARLPVSRRRLR